MPVTFSWQTDTAAEGGKKAKRLEAEGWERYATYPVDGKRVAHYRRRNSTPDTHAEDARPDSDAVRMANKLALPPGAGSLAATAPRPPEDPATGDPTTESV